jgi:hypothetical protein
MSRSRIVGKNRGLVFGVCVCLSFGYEGVNC